jgi:hypothetical protein
LPYTRSLVDGGKGLIKTGVGVVTSEEVLAVARHDADNVDEVLGLVYGVVDFSATTSLKLTASDMRQVVEANRRLALIDPGRRGIVALVAPIDTSFGTSRVWHTLSDDFGWTRDIFKDRATAIAWLRDTVPSGHDPVAFPTLNSPAPRD